MSRKILVVVFIVIASILLIDFNEEPMATPVQHHDITTKEYWIDRGYELTSDLWCAGENIAIQLYKDHEVVTINYEEQQVSSCIGGYDGCYVDYIDELKVLYSEE